MKKLSYLIVLTLILGLVLTGCFLTNVGQVPATEQSGVSGIFKNLTTITPICIGFEETEFIPGETVTGGGKVYPFLEISSSNGELNLVIIEDGGTDVSYNSSGGDNGCLDGVKGFGPIGAGAAERPLHTNRIIFEFNPGFKVSAFSINMYDYGDYIHIFDTVNTGEFEVSLNAYADDGTTLINSDSYLISGGKNNIYDACNSFGMKELSVVGLGISKVEIEFTKNIDVGVGFDNICFTPDTNICTTDLIAGQTENVGNVEVKYTPTDDFITVIYSTESSDWFLDEVHFHASDNLPDADWPVNRGGNPIPGHFYKVIEGLGGVNSYDFQIPLADIGVECGSVYFAAHAKVHKFSDDIVWANSVYSYGQGPLCNGNAIDPSLPNSNPENAKGVKDSTYLDTSTFFSMGKEGNIVLEFNNYIGGNITVYETTWLHPGDVSYPEEKAQVKVSKDGLNWISLGFADNSLQSSDNLPIPSEFYLSDCVKYIKLEDIINCGIHVGGANGFDVDAVSAQICQEETAWGYGSPFPDAKNWSMYFVCPDLVPCPFSPEPEE